MNSFKRILFTKSILILVFSVFFTQSRALAIQEFIPPRLTDPETSQISLLTVGLGEDLYTRYGHTMIRVQDTGNHIDYLANWGMFDFSDPWFIPKFFRGILIYRMGFASYKPSIRYYRDFEHRSVVEDRLVLTSKQKQAVVDKIIWNAQPENLNYPYQYFRNNCATLPRDYLDTILQGSIRRGTEQKKVGMTFRQYVRDNLGINPIVGWGLDVIFNADNDHELSAWEEMFYPPKLRAHLASIPAQNDDGTQIVGSSLLTDHVVLVDQQDPDGKTIDGYWFVAIFATIPLLFLLLWTPHSSKKLLSTAPFSENWQFRVFGLVAVFWGLTAGFFGLTHTLAWLFSAHTDLHRNVNILLFWPTDFLMFFWGVRFLVRGNGVVTALRWQKFWRSLAAAHLGFAGLFVIVAISGVSGQYLFRVLVHMVPASILYYYVLRSRIFVRS